MCAATVTADGIAVIALLAGVERTVPASELQSLTFFRARRHVPCRAVRHTHAVGVTGADDPRFGIHGPHAAKSCVTECDHNAATSLTILSFNTLHVGDISAEGRTPTARIAFFIIPVSGNVVPAISIHKTVSAFFHPAGSGTAVAGNRVPVIALLVIPVPANIVFAVAVQIPVAAADG